MKNPVTRQVARCAGEVYVVLASAIAVVELTRPAPTPFSGLVAAMLAPITLGFAGVAVHSALSTRGTWSRRRLTADIGKALASLRDRYRVLSRLPLTRYRDDRVVIGANGIFVVVTDSGPPRAGLWRGMVDDCHVEALRVRARIRRALRRPLPVYAVLCVPDGCEQEMRDSPGVRVVATSRLAGMIVNTFTTAPLSAADVEESVAALTASAIEPAPVSRRPRPRHRRQDARSQRRLMLV